MPTMATARRSTGAGRKVKQPVSFDQDASEVSDFVETEADEDSGSDYEPTSKRVKKSNETTKKGGRKATVSRKRTLSLLPTMPLDVLFEIFSNLNPMDMINLSRTTKTFRETLMSKQARTVWKSVRSRYGAPDCPYWWSEAAWAVLLFGNTCQCCGAKGILKVDFMILRRVCTQCKKNHLVVRAKFAATFPDYDDSILYLLRFTHTGGWAHGHASNSEFYWDTDVVNIDEKLNTLNHDIHLRKSGARAVLDSFRSEQSNRRTYIAENHKACEDWYEDLQDQRTDERTEKERIRLRQIKDRLKALGYIEEDLNFLNWNVEVRGKAAVTDKVWSRLCDILVPEADRSRQNRLDFESRSVRQGRYDLVKARYATYQKTVHPLQWKYLPPTAIIALMSGFAEFIGANADNSINAETLEFSFGKLDAMLIVRAEDRKRRLLGMLPSFPSKSSVESQASSSSTCVPTTQLALDELRLDLSTSVFKCQNSVQPGSFYGHFGYLFGQDEVASHHCGLSDFDQLWYRNNYLHQDYIEARKRILNGSVNTHAPNAQAIVEKILTLTGSNPLTTTPTDMDKWALKFGCAGCMPFKDSGKWYRLGYSWRDLVAHLDTYSTHNSSTSIFILTSNLANEVQMCEDSADRAEWTTRKWACTRCSDHSNNLQIRETVLAHLRDYHAVTKPIDGTDIISVQGSKPFYKHKFRYGVEAPAGASSSNSNANVRCLKCDPGSKRLFILQGVVSHLKDKHKILNPRMREDYLPVNQATVS